MKHVLERLEEVSFRHELGPTSGPEESFAKRVKADFNKKPLHTDNVKS